MQKLSIRLLREGVEPENAVREGTKLEDWDQIDGSKIVLDTLGGGHPKWATFLGLSSVQKMKLKNSSAMGLIFLKVEERWFAMSFGLGHVKIDPAKIEQDFGLKVVLNSVDPKKLRSADVRTPDENTLSRRSQTSRGSDQTAFSIDVERDIVRGLAGQPKDKNFASKVAGSDSLTIERDIVVNDLPAVCGDAFRIYQKSDYKCQFGWIDQIKHVRDDAVISSLRDKLVDKINEAIRTNDTENLHLAYPVIYDPEKGGWIQYKGFRSRRKFTDLDIRGYIDALLERKRTSVSEADLDKHAVHEVDDQGKDIGGKWSIFECLATEIDLDGSTYVLSGGRWYRIEKSLATSVKEFFDKAPRFSMPSAEYGENEEKYNKRIMESVDEYICLDKKLILPTGAGTQIEVCDFLSRGRHLIHVKDKTSSSRLSHLFNQGTVSARVLVVDGPARDQVRKRIAEAEAETDKSGFEDLVPSGNEQFVAAEFTVVFGVIASGDNPRLPFFSLLTFRQAARELQVPNFRYAFAWIRKPTGPSEEATKE